MLCFLPVAYREVFVPLRSAHSRGPLDLLRPRALGKYNFLILTYNLSIIIHNNFFKWSTIYYSTFKYIVHVCILAQ